MYKRSAKKLKQLKNAGEAFNEHVLKPVRAAGTRWIDHRKKALAVLERDYSAMVAQFQTMGSEEQKDVPAADRAKARGYATRLTSLHFILYMAHYQDLLENLAELSLHMQDESLVLSSVRSEIEISIGRILAMRDGAGPRLQKVMEATQEDGDNGIIYKVCCSLC